MDLLTQGLAGAALAGVAARPHERRMATGIGFGAGLLADADALIRSSSDPLLTLEFHRHFSHALVFIPVGGLVAALLLWPLFRGRLPVLRIYLFALLGYSLSGFLDACTSYGTHLLWPFSDARIAWNIISIVDPVFTLSLLIGVVAAYIRRSARPAAAGLAFSALYLSVGVMQHQRAEALALRVIEDRGHVADGLVAKPTLGNLLVWRTVYLADGTFYVGAVRPGITGDDTVYSGGAVKRFEPDRDLPGLAPESVLANDIRRFTAFADGWVAYHPNRKGMLGDIRYSMTPDGLEPLWGIDVDADRPGDHAAYVVDRDATEKRRQQFKTLLLGGHP